MIASRLRDSETHAVNQLSIKPSIFRNLRGHYRRF